MFYPKHKWYVKSFDTQRSQIFSSNLAATSSNLLIYIFKTARHCWKTKYTLDELHCCIVNEYKHFIRIMFQIFGETFSIIINFKLSLLNETTLKKVF